MVIGPPTSDELITSSEFLEKESMVLNLLRSFLSVFNLGTSKARKSESIQGERTDFEDILFNEYPDLEGDSDVKNVLDTVFTLDVNQINSTNLL